MAENGSHFSGEGHLIEAVVLNDSNKTVVPVVCDAQGRLIIDVAGSTFSIGKVDQGAAGTDPWPVIVTAAQPLTADHLISVSASILPVKLLDANINRKVLTIYNFSNSDMYVRFGSDITDQFWDIRLTKNCFWESGFYSWQGEVWGLWDSATGKALVSELA